jgi:hypothetical protein
MSEDNQVTDTGLHFALLFTHAHDQCSARALPSSPTPARPRPPGCAPPPAPTRPPTTTSPARPTSPPGSTTGNKPGGDPPGPHLIRS